MWSVDIFRYCRFSVHDECLLVFQGLDSEGKPLLTVWFRVQFYVDQVVLLRYAFSPPHEVSRKMSHYILEGRHSK
jgi:hypothetical protein